MIGFLIISITGCKKESEEERLKRNIRETEKSAQKAMDDYRDTQRAANDYNYYSSKVK